MPVLTEARVSLRMGARAPVVLEAAGGAVAHAGDYRVNGVEARVEVFAFKEAQPDLAPSLLRRFGLEPETVADKALVRLPAQYGQVWLLMLPGMTADVALAVLVKAEGDLASGSPHWPFSDIAQTPGLALDFSATSRATGLSICTGRHELQAGAAMQVAAGQLRRAGWAPATPAADKVSAALFARGDEVALVCAVPRDSGSSLLIMKRSHPPSR
ncbi:MAG: hypothetical protein ACOX9C_12975 [Kiritimatiellia bacterium]